jgi:PadR family transcriptional regulator PadR
MIKRIKEQSTNSILSQEKYRRYLETFESEALRGIGTLCVLHIISQHKEEGIYGYQLIKELEILTNERIIIEEGRLYPMLKNLESWGSVDQQIKLIRSERKFIDNRSRNYYVITDEGKMLYNYMQSIYLRLIQSAANLFHFQIEINPESRTVFCSNCGNKVDLNQSVKNCEVCGKSFEDFQTYFFSDNKNPKETMK